MILKKFAQKKVKFTKKVGGLLNEEEAEMLVEVIKVNNLQQKYERFKKRYALNK